LNSNVEQCFEDGDISSDKHATCHCWIHMCPTHMSHRLESLNIYSA
jgi:hypothetical protein